MMAKLTVEEIRREYASEFIKPERVLQLAKMKNFPPDLLAELATSDPYAFMSENNLWRARKFARSHPNLPVEILQKYIDWGRIHYEALYVIEDVLKNPNITTEMFAQMLELPDIDWEEHQALLGLPKISWKKIDDPERMEMLLAAISPHPNCPISALAKAVEHEETWTRMHAAKSPNLSPAQIRKLLYDPMREVRINVVRNKKIPVSSLMSILDPLPVGVKQKAAQYRVIQFLVMRLPEESEDRARALALLVSMNQGQRTRVLIAKDTKDMNEIGRKVMDKSRAVRKVAVKNSLALPEHKVAATLMGEANTNVIMVKKG